VESGGTTGDFAAGDQGLGCAVRDDILGVVFFIWKALVQVLPAPKANLDCSWAICRVKSRFPSEICRVADLTRQIARPRFSKRLGYQTGHQSASRQKHLFPTTAATLPHAPMSAEGTEGAFPSRPALIRLKDHHTASKRKAPTNPMARAHEAQTKTATQLESWMAVRCLKCL
jgi:hypothetical protein